MKKHYIAILSVFEALFVGRKGNLASSDWKYFCSPSPLPLDGKLVHRWFTLQHEIRRYLFIHLGGERHCESSVLPKNITLRPWQGLEPRLLDSESSTLTTGPRRLPHLLLKKNNIYCDSKLTQTVGVVLYLMSLLRKPRRDFRLPTSDF